MTSSINRIYAMVLRYMYILFGSKMRIIELVYWPLIQMVLWAFISQYLMTNVTSGAMYIAGYLLAGVMLWDMLFRTQLGVSISVMEEFWSRNLGHLFVSPIRPWEWWASTMVVGLVRGLVGTGVAAVVAYALYHYNIIAIGPALALCMLNVILMGWWLGVLTSALLLKGGPGVEGFAWAFPFMLVPVAAVYYPVSILPDWLQTVAYALPASHAFEGMRHAVRTGSVDMAQFSIALGLNIFYMLVSLGVMTLVFNSCRKHGAFLKMGE